MTQQTDVAKTVLHTALKLNDEGLKRKTQGALEGILQALDRERGKPN